MKSKQEVRNVFQIRFNNEKEKKTKTGIKNLKINI